MYSKPKMRETLEEAFLCVSTCVWREQDVCPQCSLLRNLVLCVWVCVCSIFLPMTWLSSSSPAGVRLVVVWERG